MFRDGNGVYRRGEADADRRRLECRGQEMDGMAVLERTGDDWRVQGCNGMARQKRRRWEWIVADWR